VYYYKEKVDEKKNTKADLVDGQASTTTTITQPSKYMQSRNKLKDDVLAEVMGNIMPDIGKLMMIIRQIDNDGIYNVMMLVDGEVLS